MSSRMYQTGDWVIYRMQKVSTSPGPRAQDVMPSPRGEDYSYLVDKYWVVDEVQGNGQLVLKTRKGKTHIVGIEDPNLRHPRWWERWLLAGRFRAVEEGLAE